MANDTNSNRVWVLDTAAIIAAAGVATRVRMIHFFPTTAADELLIQEYGPDAAKTVRYGVYAIAAPSVVAPILIDFGPKGRHFNGFKLTTLTNGVVVVYLA